LLGHGLSTCAIKLLDIIANTLQLNHFATSFPDRVLPFVLLSNLLELFDNV
jgi:hypothetical protein